MKTCPICRELVSTLAYDKHLARYHAGVRMTLHDSMLPVKVSDRTTKEIVKDMERKLGSFIIETTMGEHLDACRCTDCQIKFLQQMEKEGMVLSPLDNDGNI